MIIQIRGVLRRKSSSPTSCLKQSAVRSVQVAQGLSIWALKINMDGCSVQPLRSLQCSCGECLILLMLKKSVLLLRTSFVSVYAHFVLSLSDIIELL